MRACASRLHAPSHRTAVAGGIYSSAGAARCAHARVHRPGPRASAAGITWTSRTAKTPWAARSDHTSVIDAAGAIYVIGGIGRDYPDYTYYRDVWASTDGGAQPGAVNGMVGGYSRG